MLGSENQVLEFKVQFSVLIIENLNFRYFYKRERGQSLSFGTRHYGIRENISKAKQQPTKYLIEHNTRTNQISTTEPKLCIWVPYNHL